MACVVLNALSAVSCSTILHIIIRLLAAGASCTVTPAGAAIFANIWEVKEKGKAMSVYYIGVLLGPALGPVLRFALNQRWSWRATL